MINTAPSTTESQLRHLSSLLPPAREFNHFWRSSTHKDGYMVTIFDDWQHRPTPHSVLCDHDKMMAGWISRMWAVMRL